MVLETNADGTGVAASREVKGLDVTRAIAMTAVCRT